MTSVVLDTNIVVSAHINEDGLEGVVLDLAFNHHIKLYLSQPIVEEYELVLARSKFRLDVSRVKHSVQQIRSMSAMIKPRRQLHVSSDDYDNRFLECAETAKADYLVTGNKRHFPKRWKTTRVVNAREFLQIVIPQALA